MGTTPRQTKHGFSGIPVRFLSRLWGRRASLEKTLSLCDQILVLIIETRSEPILVRTRPFHQHGVRDSKIGLPQCGYCCPGDITPILQSISESHFYTPQFPKCKAHDQSPRLQPWNLKRASGNNELYQERKSARHYKL